MHQIQYSGTLCSIDFFFSIYDFINMEVRNRVSACTIGYS